MQSFASSRPLASVGGRARQLVKEGFTFDIGPTWYWMPDVFERFFGDFNKKPSDYYELIKLSPAAKDEEQKQFFIYLLCLQCDQIWRIFAIFSKIYKSLTNL